VATAAPGLTERLDHGGRLGTHDLGTADGLLAACHAVGEGDPEWNRRLAAVLEWWSGLPESARADRDNQQRLWEDNHVAAVGQGRIPVDRALHDEKFRAWLAQRSLQPLPDDWDARAEFIEKLNDDLRDQVMERLEDSARPMLKIFRVMAVLHPSAMTTVAAMGALHELGRAMGEPRKLYGAQRQVWVRRRIDDALGPVAPGWEAQAARMTLPWLLLERNVRRSADKTEKVERAGIDTKLQPLPAARRRRGLTAIRGLFPGLLSTLEFVRPGVSRDELLDFLRSNAPDSKTTSLGVTINAYQGELDAIRSSGGLYVLSERGEDVLETQDPSFLADWLLTRILGIDRALTELRDNGTLPRAALLAAVSQMNPGWTSTFAPSAQLSWLLSMKVIKFDSHEGFRRSSNLRRSTRRCGSTCP
jgi:5-methylcytosine-specific restriction protein B